MTLLVTEMGGRWSHRWSHRVWKCMDTSGVTIPLTWTFLTLVDPRRPHS